MIVKVTLVFIVALLAAACMRRAAAATRHAMLASAQVVALVLPLLAMWLPPVTIPDEFNVGRASARLPRAHMPPGEAG